MTTAPNISDVQTRLDAALREAGALIDRQAALESEKLEAEAALAAGLVDGDTAKAETALTRISTSATSIRVRLRTLRAIVLSLDEQLAEARRAEALASLPKLRDARAKVEVQVSEIRQDAQRLSGELSRVGAAVAEAERRANLPGRLPVLRFVGTLTPDGAVGFEREDSAPIADAWEAAAAHRVRFADHRRQALAEAGGDHA
ncbi:MAG: hypothetical protein MUF10_10750 [Thermoanaerobaculaceae bacterium]|jgi:chromosome segregation ATPase|nr:hypothetical protein [Thermoanaerobaculaceae bacterium]